MPAKIFSSVVVMTTIRGGCKELHFLPPNHSTLSYSNFSPHLPFPRGCLPRCVFRNNQRRKEQIERDELEMLVDEGRRIVTWCERSRPFRGTYSYSTVAPPSEEKGGFEKRGTDNSGLPRSINSMAYISLLSVV
jgi:hypothetical protein